MTVLDVGYMFHVCNLGTRSPNRRCNDTIINIPNHIIYVDTKGLCDRGNIISYDKLDLLSLTFQIVTNCPRHNHNALTIRAVHILVDWYENVSDLKQVLITHDG